MRRLVMFAVGIGSGLAFGAAVALLLSPASGEAMRREARSRFDELMRDAEEAAEARRRELEAELAAMTKVEA